MNFIEIYDLPFGKHGKIERYPDPETNEFEIDFLTPSHSEEDVRFEFSMMTYLFNRDDAVLEIWDGNEMLYTDGRSISMFVNLDGVDPKAGKPSGHPDIIIGARETHLLPSHVYTLRVYRKTGATDKKPLNVVYYGTDANEVEFGTDAFDNIPMVFAGVSGKFVKD